MSVHSKPWARRAEFVNAVLVLAASYNDLAWTEVVLDGVAGEKFDHALEHANVVGCEDQRDDYINTALKFGVPIDGLVADGEFGDKWREVVALCKKEAAA